MREYTVTIFSENDIGLLNEVTIVFSRRKINIESLTVSESEVKGVFRYTIVAFMDDHRVENVVRQIEKIIGVFKAFYFEADQIVHQEVALFKIANSPTLNGNLEALMRKQNAKILTVQPEFLVIEKVGYKAENQELFNELEQFGVLQFARSGRVAVSCQQKEFTSYLKELTH
ncbi:acetolactate synthase small subunit [Marinifilum sp. N1E240]|uniref:acetolactate synthase small subunit n=1 Tax=Marinifilum sp. N1E240 TaxID=2608082 RepID=UPI00128B101F|nr:acetolactate synthase small subunit [Marinifilum sp. N1E240]MPQ46146.1 acetolactate synthase small subunit [Marinifilum sp. N1E240]